MGNQHADKSYDAGSAIVDTSSTRPDSSATRVDANHADMNLVHLTVGDHQTDALAKEGEASDGKVATNTTTLINFGDVNALYGSTAQAPKASSLDAGGKAMKNDGEAARLAANEGSEGDRLSKKLLESEFSTPPQIVDRKMEEKDAAKMAAADNDEKDIAKPTVEAIKRLAAKANSPQIEEHMLKLHERMSTYA